MNYTHAKHSDRPEYEGDEGENPKELDVFSSFNVTDVWKQDTEQPDARDDAKVQFWEELIKERYMSALIPLQA